MIIITNHGVLTFKDKYGTWNEVNYQKTCDYVKENKVNRRGTAALTMRK